MAVKLGQVWRVSQGDVDMGAISYVDYLDSGELLTGTPTAVEQTTTDLTIENVAVSTGALTILGESAATGQAVQFKFSGQQSGTSYVVRVTAATDSTPARTVVRDQIIICE